MDKSPFKFYLTGSRAFGTDRPDSDWDFFAKDNAILQAYLVGIGFTEHFKSYKDDPQIVTVYRKEGVGRKSVDIQLVTDINKKMAAQYALKEQQNFRPSKEQWRLIYKALGKLEELERIKNAD